MGFTTATFIVLGIYVAFWVYILVYMMVGGLNVWFSLIPIVASVVILIQTMVKVYSGYKNISSNAYVGANIYPANYYVGNNYQGNPNNY